MNRQVHSSHRLAPSRREWPRTKSTCRHRWVPNRLRWLKKSCSLRSRRLGRSRRQWPRTKSTCLRQWVPNQRGWQRTNCSHQWVRSRLAWPMKSCRCPRRLGQNQLEQHHYKNRTFWAELQVCIAKTSAENNRWFTS